MHTIVALNKISARGLDLFPTERYAVVRHEGEGTLPAASAIVLRSTDLHDLRWWYSDSVLTVARAGAGTNNIPVAELSERGVVVFNTPGANANSVKELVVAAMIMALRHIPAALQKVDALARAGGNVLAASEAAKKAFSGTEVSGKMLGVVGLGQIGVLVANAAHDLGMRVVGYDPAMSVQSAWRIHDGVTRANSIEELLGSVDVVTVHVPFFEATRHLLGPRALKQLKRGVIVLNFSRDGIVDDDAMLAALHDGTCSAYVTDFPHALYAGMEQVIQLPHLGASTAESEVRCAQMAVRQICDYLDMGEIKNSVNFPNVSLRHTEGTRMVILHRNVPAMLGDLSSILGKRGLNIGSLQNESRGAYAATVLCVDAEEVSEEARAQLAGHEDVYRVHVIPAA